MVHPVGTPEAIEMASSRSTLMKSLERAAVNKDIVADVADACEIKEYTAMHLADSALEASVVAKDLYLTVEEATLLKQCCLLELAEIGVKVADGGDLPAPEGDGAGAAAKMTNPPPAVVDAVENEAKAEADKSQKTETPYLIVDAQGVPDDDEVAAEADEEAKKTEEKPSTPVREFLASSAPSKTTKRPETARAHKEPEPLAEQLVEDYSNLPSYLRPTASARKKAKNPNSDAEDKKPSRPNSASVRISSSLLRPTAASQHRASQKHEKPLNPMSQSTNLDRQMGAAAAARTKTTPKPFKLSTEGRSGQQPLTTDEIRVMRAQKEMQSLKEKSAKKLWKTPPPQPRQQQAPSDLRASTQFKPFSLSSTELHNKAQTVWEAQLLEQQKQEKEARKFKARPVTYNKARTYTDVVSEVEQSVAQQKKFTQGAEPVLQSMQRSQVHKALEEEKRIREAEAAVSSAAEEKLKEEKEDMDLKEMRKSLAFHAQAMPNFDSPFKPDPSLSTPPTKGKAPAFQTDKRSAHRGSTEKCEPDPLVGTPSAAAIDLFASTLRSSVNSPKGVITSGKASALKEVVVKLDITAV